MGCPILEGGGLTKSDRRGHGGGGVENVHFLGDVLNGCFHLLFVEIDISSSLKHTSYEGVLIKMPKKLQGLIIGVIYRPSGQSIMKFNEELQILLNTLTQNKNRVMLIGDFNN